MAGASDGGGDYHHPEGTHLTISTRTGPTDPRKRLATHLVPMESQQFPVLKPSIILPHYPTPVPETQNASNT